MIRVHRIPFSTNVERVALGCGIKGVGVEWVDHDPADRSAIEALGAGSLVPVAEIDGEVIGDSIRILERIDALNPNPGLWPAGVADRAAAEIFVEWFNEVWKGPPNELNEGPAPERAASLSERIAAWTDRFERLLADRPFLLGERLSIADVCAYPFLRYAVDAPDSADSDPFHGVLHAHVPAGSGPALRGWVARMAVLPQA